MKQKYTKSGASTEKVNDIKLKNVTNFMLSQLEDNEIMRFGDGWITICQKCKSFIIIGPEFKTFASSELDQLRIAPSIACPRNDCDWHVSILVEKEIEEEETEEEIEEDDITESEVIA